MSTVAIVAALVLAVLWLWWTVQDRLADRRHQRELDQRIEAQHRRFM